MSQWTHINGNVRIDSLGDVSIPRNPSNVDAVKKEWENVLGRVVLYNDENWETTAPMGSEGSVEYEIYAVSRGYNIGVWADLRDFGLEDLDKLKEWFDKILKHKSKSYLGFIREAVFHVDVEYGPKFIYLLSHEGKGGYKEISI